ncbi:MAG: hypothetical protein ACLT38_05735 [Akkermansia sp.]
MWRKRVTTFDAMSNLPRAQKSAGGKFPFPHAGNRGNPRLCGHHTEIPHQNGRRQPGRIRHHSCRSSGKWRKIGARHPLRFFPGRLCLRPQFCASGLLGLKRHLTTGEIIGQILSAEAIAGNGSTTSSSWAWGNPFPILTTWWMPWKSSLPTAVWK